MKLVLKKKFSLPLSFLFHPLFPGIGYETALAASKSGLKVFACCLDSTSSGACGLQERSSNVQVLQMDVTKTEDVEAAVNHVTKVCGSQGVFSLPGTSYE